MPSLSCDAALEPGRSLTDCIGDTPLLRLERLVPGVRLYAKAEWYNPGQSVKDRAVWGIVQAAEADGALTPDRTILDATSGNTGIAYAMIGAARGYRVQLCMPAGVTPERARILRAYGAGVVLTDAAESSDGAIRKARELYAAEPGRYFYGDQYSNEANWRAHYRTTGPELHEQTGGRLTHFVGVLGTSGTFVGAGRYLRERDPGVRLVEVQPDSPFHGLEGMKHMGSAIVPAFYDPGLADERLGIATETAYRWVKDTARREGLLVGISAGAALAAAAEVARRDPEAVVATVLPDNGVKYLSERFWDAI